MRAKPVTSVSPYSALNSSNREPSTMRAISSRASAWWRKSSGTSPYSSAASAAGGSGSATSQGGSGLRACRLRLVEEDPPEVVAIGEDLVLQREEGAAGVDEIDAGQPVLLGDLLRAEMLLDRQWEVRAALHGRVVGDDHALAPLDDADSRHDPGRGRGAVVDVPGRERVQLEERRVRVEQPVDPLPGRQLAPRAMPLERFLAAAARDRRRPLAQLGHERRHSLTAVLEAVRPFELGGQDGHGAKPTDPA
jgi:hypothetical protein